MSKKKIIAVVVIMVVLFVAVLAVFIPRIKLRAEIKEKDYNFKPVEYITDFTAEIPNGELAGNNYLTLYVPEGCRGRLVLDETETEVFSYIAEDNSLGIAFSVEPKNLYEELEKYLSKDNEEYELISSYNAGKVLRSYDLDEKKSGYYEFVKASLLLDSENVSFWNMKEASGYVFLAEIRKDMFDEKSFNELTSREIDIYLYERDDVRAIISTKEPSMYTGWVLNTKDLNNAFSLQVRADDINVLYGVLNSIDFK